MFEEKVAQRQPRELKQRESSDEAFSALRSSPVMVAQRQRLESAFGLAPHVSVSSDATSEVAQREVAPAKENNTGLPNQLKAGIESLSGMSMDHVLVHYNSSKPAQLNAHAYAQGSQIHLAPGQEKHLPHEAWHVVQQAQGRVKATTQMKSGVPVNDDVGLEREADVMGAKATTFSRSSSNEASQALSGGVGQLRSNTVQRRVGFEFQTNWEITPDPYGAVEGLASFMGSSIAESYGLNSPEAFGFLSGRLARAPMALAEKGISGLSSFSAWALGRVGGQHIVDRVQRFVTDMRPTKLKAIPKGFALIRGTGWNMSSDEGEMEFVTDPFGEHNFGALATAMAQIHNFNISLLGMQHRTYIPINWYRGVTLLGNLAAVVPHGGNIIGMPQMTAGVDLTQIKSMMRYMATPGNTRNKTVRNRGLYLTAVMSNLAPGLSKRSRAYQGIVSLMANYVIQSAGLPMAIPKDIASIMARSNLGVAFRATPEYVHRSQGGAGIEKLKQQLNHFVFSTAHAAATALAYAMVVPVTRNMRLFPSADGVAPRTGPTLTNWVNGVVDGDDPMRANYARLTSRSMSAMNRLETVGAGNADGMIMEFRDLPAMIPYQDWAAYAADMMRWMEYVNDRNRRKKTHPT